MNEEQKNQYKLVFEKTVEEVVNNTLNKQGFMSVTKEQLIEEIELDCEFILKGYYHLGFKPQPEIFESEFHSVYKLHNDWFNRRKEISNKYKTIRFDTMWSRNNIRLEDYSELPKKLRDKWDCILSRNIPPFHSKIEQPTVYITVGKERVDFRNLQYTLQKKVYKQKTGKDWDNRPNNTHELTMIDVTKKIHTILKKGSL